MDAVAERVAAVQGRIVEYQTLLDSPILQKDDGRTQVYLGDGYFADVPNDEGRRFVERKVAMLQQELAQLNQLRGVNEEGLPILDIVEELDGDDNIVNSRVERAGSALEDLARKSARQSDPTSRGRNSPQNHARITEIIDPQHEQSKSPPSQSNELSPNIQPTVVDTLEKSSVHDYAETEPEEELHVESQDAEDDLTSHDTLESLSQISHDDILELELVDDDENGVDDIDYNFANVSEEDDENEDDDDDTILHDDEYDSNTGSSEDDSEYNYGWRGGSLFPQDERTQKLLQRHFPGTESESRSEEEPEEPADAAENVAEEPKKARGSVHFADSVSVREFETTSSERKGLISLDDRPKKASQFKLQRLSPQSQPSNGGSSQRSAALAAAVKASAGSGPVASAASAAAQSAVAASVHERAPSATQSAPRPPKAPTLRASPRMPMKSAMKQHSCESVTGAVKELSISESNTSNTDKDQHSAPESPTKKSPAKVSNTNEPPARRLSPKKSFGEVRNRKQPPTMDHKASEQYDAQDALKPTPGKHIVKQAENLEFAESPSDIPLEVATELGSSQPAGSTEDIKGASNEKQLVTEKKQDAHAITSDSSTSPQEGRTTLRNVYSRRYNVPERKPKPVPLKQPSERGPAPDPEFVGVGDIRDEDLPDDAPDALKKRVSDTANRYFEESFLPDDDFISLHDGEDDDDHSNENDNGFAKARNETEVDRPVLEPTVVERDQVQPQSEEDSDAAEYATHMSEIKMEYQKLRQRLVYESGGYRKTEEEAAVEPAEEKPRVSRFKAARIRK